MLMTKMIYFKPPMCYADCKIAMTYNIISGVNAILLSAEKTRVCLPKRCLSQSRHRDLKTFGNS